MAYVERSFSRMRMVKILDMIYSKFPDFESYKITIMWVEFREYQLCTNLRVQEQSMNMTSQYQYIAIAWRQR